MEEKKNRPKGLMIDIDENLRAEIKARAAFRHMSIRKWIMQAIAERIKWEDKYK